MHGWEAHALKDSQLTFVGLLPDLAPINLSADLAPFRPLPNLALESSVDGVGDGCCRAKGVTIPNCKQGKVETPDLEDKARTQGCILKGEGEGEGEGRGRLT